MDKNELIEIMTDIFLDKRNDITSSLMLIIERVYRAKFGEENDVDLDNLEKIAPKVILQFKDFLEDRILNEIDDFLSFLDDNEHEFLYYTYKNQIKKLKLTLTDNVLNDISIKAWNIIKNHLV